MCKSIEYEQHGSCIVIDDGRGFAPGEEFEPMLDDMFPPTSAPSPQIVLKRRWSGCDANRIRHQLLAEERPSEVSVNYRSG